MWWYWNDYLSSLQKYVVKLLNLLFLLGFLQWQMMYGALTKVTYRFVRNNGRPVIPPHSHVTIEWWDKSELVSNQPKMLNDGNSIFRFTEMFVPFLTFHKTNIHYYNLLPSYNIFLYAFEFFNLLLWNEIFIIHLKLLCHRNMFGMYSM